MRTHDEIVAELDSVEMEMRSLINSVKDTSKECNTEEAKTTHANLVNRKNALIKELAECEKPNEVEERSAKAGLLFRTDEWLKSAREQRSITIGDVGAINQIKTLIKEIAETDDILNRASYYYGADASTLIPVLTPISDPTGQSEGASGITDDSDASITVTEIQPKAYVSILPITAEMLAMGAVNIESELPTIFAKSFRKVMHNGMLQGTGSNKAMKGLFVSASANTAGITTLAQNQTSIKLSDLAGLALRVSSKDETFEIVMNPSTYQNILSDSTSGEDVKLYKEGLIRDKSIEGVKIILDAQAPSATTAGSILAVAVPLSRYAIGVAGQLEIKPIHVKGDTKTYYQAMMFFSGKQVTDTDLYSLAVATPPPAP